jgi:co-chaperonin GroES (HSP10)
MSDLDYLTSKSGDEEHANQYEDLEKLDLPLSGVEPLFWRLLVAPVMPPQQTASGIFLPDQTQEAREEMSYIGKVVAMGQGCLAHERLRNGYDGQPAFDLGDYVVIKRYAGLRLSYKGLKLRAVNDDDVLIKTTEPFGWKVLV